MILPFCYAYRREIDSHCYWQLESARGTRISQLSDAGFAAGIFAVAASAFNFGDN
jgi:hypothetical protein